jgi:hypothetical protein
MIYLNSVNCRILIVKYLISGGKTNGTATGKQKRRQ